MVVRGALVEPVFKAEARDFGEIHSVAGQQRGIMRDGNGCDFQIQRADTNALTAELQHKIHRLGVEGKDDP